MLEDFDEPKAKTDNSHDPEAVETNECLHERVDLREIGRIHRRGMAAYSREPVKVLWCEHCGAYIEDTEGAEWQLPGVGVE